MRVWEANTPAFCQDGATDLFKIDQKVIWEREVANFREVEGVAKMFIYAQPIL